MGQTLPYIYPVDTLTEKESSVWNNGIDSQSNAIVNLMADYSTAEFLHDTLAPAFSLSESQLNGVGRFIADLVFKGIPTNQCAPALAKRAGIGLTVATQIIKELESDLLEPLELTLTGLATTVGRPKLVEDPTGRTGLRYATLDSLMADIEALSPDQRVQFLQDAKKDNRIIVLKALTQLKLGTDASGRPLSFTSLAAQESPQFQTQDWADLLSTSPDTATDKDVRKSFRLLVDSSQKAQTVLSNITTAMGISAFHRALTDPLQTADIRTYLTATPLLAALSGKDSKQQDEVSAQFLAAPPEIRTFLAAPQTVGGPPTHAVAIAKMLFLLCTKQVSLKDVPTVLQQLSLAPEEAARLTATISELTAPFVEDEESVREVQTVPTPKARVVVPSNRGQSRNIIDLRKP